MALDPARWAAVSPFLDEALDIADAETRRQRVAALCVEHPEVAGDLLTLLDEHQALGREQFLEGSVETPAGAPMSAGQAIGAYRLVSPLGGGGMGTVWLAERSDGRFTRGAAIKFLNAAFAGRGGERFRREGRILARLTHPRIAQLVDAGVTAAGQPYLVLEHVDGEQIDRYCDAHALDVSARVRLFLEVLDAVAHAHTNLIVHRDIKPSNVLVGADGHVKLLDFGIAKLLEEDDGIGATVLTQEGGRAMTPAYAAPEQMTGEPITTATDVYALGVLLYVLLTGRHPGGSLRSAADLMKAIVETEPPRASEAATGAARRLLRGDLDTIVGQSLKKRPGDRYPSVAEFADDLRRYLQHEPIRARRDAAWYRVAKFVRRNRVAVALGALALVAAAAGVAGTLLQARTARSQRDLALREMASAEAVNDLNTFVLSDAAPSGTPFTVDDLLARAEHIVQRQRGDPTVRIELLIAIGHQYTVQEEYAKAQRLLEEAHAEAQAVSDPSSRAVAACTLAQAVANVRDLPRAELLLREGLDALPDQPTFVTDRIYCLERGSEVAVRRGAGQDAIDRATEAERLLAQAPIRSDLTDLDAAIALAGAYVNAGRHREANAAFEKASARLDALGRDDTARAATVFNNWGVSLGVLGRPRDAQRVLERAVAISRRDARDESVSPMLLVNYARVLNDLGRTAEADGYARIGYDKGVRTGADVLVSQASLLRASIARAGGDLTLADRMLAGAETWLRKNLPPGHVAFAALESQQSLVAQARGDLPAALRLANDAVAIAETAERKQGGDSLRTYLTRRADIELVLSRPDEAARDAGRALRAEDVLSTAPLTSVTGRAYLALGRALQAQHRSGEAAAAFRSAVTHLDSALGPDHADTREARRLLDAAAHPV